MIVDGCKGCNIKILSENALITDTCEIMNCENCEFLFRTTLLTLQVDNVKNSSFQYPYLPAKEMKIIWAQNSVENKVQLVKLSEDFKELQVSSSFDVSFNKPTTPENQFRSCFGQDSLLYTVELIREGAGYLTTEEEKKFNDMKEEKNRKILEHVLNVGNK